MIFRQCTENRMKLWEKRNKVNPTVSSAYYLEAVSAQGGGIRKSLATLSIWARLNIQGCILERMLLHTKGEFQRSIEGSLWLNTNLWMCERKLTGWRMKYKKAASHTVRGVDIGLRLFHFLLVRVERKCSVWGIW